MSKELPFAVRDNHMHVWRELPIDNTVAFHVDIIKRFNYETVTLLGIEDQVHVPESRSIMDNLKILYLKKKLAGKVYGYAGLHLKQGQNKSTATQLLEQAKMYYAAGFDGIKLFNSVGQYECGFPPLSYELFKPFFQFMEDSQFPIILHLGAPEVCFRDINEIPESQRKWKARNCYIHPYDYYRDFFTVMKRHPKLRIVLAHFGFLTEHMDWAGAALDEFENLYFDLTPSLFMYYDFQKNKEEWTEFFTKYQDRIIYGTDIGSNTEDIENKEPDSLVHVVQGFFSSEEPIFEFDDSFSPMPLPMPILEKIFSTNALRLYNHRKPNLVCAKAIFPEIEFQEKYGKKTPVSEQNLDKFKVEFGY